MNGLAFTVWALIPMLLIMGEVRAQYIEAKPAWVSLVHARTAQVQAAMRNYRKALSEASAQKPQPPAPRFTGLLDLMDGHGVNPLRVLAGVVLGGVIVGLLFLLWFGLLGLVQ